MLATFFDSKTKTSDSFTSDIDGILFALADGKLNDRLVIHGSVNCPCIQRVVHQITCIKGFDSEAILILVFFKKSLRNRSVFNSDCLSF